MEKRKRSVFAYILIPLLVFVVIQGFFSYFILSSAGTVEKLNQNSVEILNQTSENRKNLLENYMIFSCSNVSKQKQDIDLLLKQYLKQNNLSIHQFMAQGLKQEEFLQEMPEIIIEGMRRSKVTGSFLVLSGGPKEERTAKSGIYFRDSDPDKNPSDYTDLTLVIGSAEIAKKQHVPLGDFWTKKFPMQDLTDQQQAFYWNPLLFARDNPGKEEYLGYWSAPFRLSTDTKKDSYEQITYSVPLLYEGEVYGVFGMEIEVSYLKKNIPIKELDPDKCASYLYAAYENDNELKVLAESGSLLTTSDMPEGILTLEPTKYDNLFQIQNTDLYLVKHDLKLYHSSSPFVRQQPVLAAVTTKAKLFDMGQIVSARFLLSTSVCILFGCIFMYYVAGRATKPIRTMSDYIKEHKEGDLRLFTNTRVKEIDELYGVICELSEQQRVAKDALSEERERYRIALESSTDIIFEYNRKEDCLYQYQFDKNQDHQEDQGTLTTKRYDHLIRLIDTDHQFSFDDKYELKQFFRKDVEYADCLVYAESSENHKAGWYEFRGKAIYDQFGQVIKRIGSIRNKTQEISHRQEEETRKNIDKITGLWNLEAGRRQLLNEEEDDKTVYLALLDIDQFTSMNEQYGMVFGDMVLEEIGQIVRDNLMGSDRGIRCGGDQILLILENKTRKETELFLRLIYKQVEELNVRANLRIGISIGVVLFETKESEFDEAMQIACNCVSFAKKNRNKFRERNSSATENGLWNERIAFYDSLTEKEQEECRQKEGNLSEVMGIHYEKEMNLSTILFNLFDKVKDVNSVISLTLGKISKAYGCSDAMILVLDYDFYTSSIYYQWHQRVKDIIQDTVYKGNREEFGRAVQSMRDYANIYQMEQGGREEFRKFFFQKENRTGACFPVFEKGLLTGAIVFQKEEGRESFQNEELEYLEELVSIIRTNMSKNKFDLASKAKSEFLSRMSHEIRTPMNAILGMCNIALSQPDLPPKVQDCLEKVNTSSEYLLSLINGILDMSKIENGKLNIEQAPFHLLEMLDEIKMLILPQAEKKGLQFTVEADVSCQELLGDYLRLNQILLNLLGNALKFTKAGGRIGLLVKEIHSDSELAGIHFIVRDNGIGIAKDQFDKIFVPFEQAEEGTSRKYGGTGLGLPISKNLVEMMGGELMVQSELGKGSEFSFVIMMKRSLDPAVEKSKESEMVNRDFEGKRVLLVEDIELNMEIAKTILETSHFKVETAENGEIAVHMFEKAEPGYYDVILMDVRMPVMDGLEATREIRRMKRPDAMDIPIVAMTANAFDEDMKKSMECGMNGHLNKPIEMVKFYKMLNKVLNSQDVI